MPGVAVVTDTTHYLPRDLADAAGIVQVSLYVNWPEGQEREIDMSSFDAFYDRLRTAADLPTTSQPSIGDFLAVPRPRAATAPAVDGHLLARIRAARGGRDGGRLDPLGRRDLGDGGERAPGRRAGGRARRGHGLRDGVRRVGPGRACGGPGGARRGVDGGGRRGRARGAGRAEDLVRDRHTRLPAARGADRQGPGDARRRAEDQADPVAGVRDRSRRTSPDLRARVRAAGRLRALAQG